MESRPTLSVLVVDDEQLMRDLVGRVVMSLGYRVRYAVNAEEALTAVSAEPPAVAVCDVHMPGNSGLWLREQVHRQSPTTAIVLATGDDAVPPVDTLSPGVVAYVLKPFRNDQLRSAIRLGVSWSADQQAKSPQPRPPINLDDLK